MADMAGRLRQVEKHMAFVMDNIRMRAAVVNNGILGPDGQPALKVFEGSLRELYAMSRAMPSTAESENPNADEMRDLALDSELKDS
jgi:hypothetical protein